ncbi:Outer membrane usher protein papC precursor [Serratia ficaria]|nr:Outer membrane usher protein papC precursor [Serratia ficaria]
MSDYSMTSLLTRKNIPIIVILSFLWVRPAQSATEFNTDVLDIGDRSKVDLSRFSDADYVMPGAYLLDIKINQKTLPQRSIQYYPSADEKTRSRVCLPPDLVEKMALKEEAAKKITFWQTAAPISAASRARRFPTASAAACWRSPFRRPG